MCVGVCIRACVCMCLCVCEFNSDDYVIVSFDDVGWLRSVSVTLA